VVAVIGEIEWSSVVGSSRIDCARSSGFRTRGTDTGLNGRIPDSAGSTADTAEYLDYRLKQAECKRDVFSENAQWHDPDDEQATRLIHRAYKLNLKGPSRRKEKPKRK